MPNFTIIKQRNRPGGCIPACAAGVLRFLQVPGDWTESYILNMYSQNLRGSGFEILKQFLEQLQGLSQWNITIKKSNEIDLKTFLLEQQENNNPVLFPINRGPELPAHCVVIIQAEDRGAKIADPWPGNPAYTEETWGKLERIWAGDILFFTKKH